MSPHIHQKMRKGCRNDNSEAFGPLYWAKKLFKKSWGFQQPSPFGGRGLNIIGFFFFFFFFFFVFLSFFFFFFSREYFPALLNFKLILKAIVICSPENFCFADSTTACSTTALNYGRVCHRCMENPCMLLVVNCNIYRDYSLFCLFVCFCFYFVLFLFLFLLLFFCFFLNNNSSHPGCD